MKGILRLAFLLRVNDRGKFAALLVGIPFASFLMVPRTNVSIDDSQPPGKPGGR